MGLKYTILGYRELYSEDPGTFVSLLPTTETYRNLCQWLQTLGLRPMKKPYGLMHATVLSTKKTVNIPNLRFLPEVLVDIGDMELKIVEYTPGRKSLIVVINDQRLVDYRQKLHEKAGVVPQERFHMTLAYALPPGFRLPAKRPPFVLGFSRQVVEGKK